MKAVESYQRLKAGEIHVYLIRPEAVDITPEDWLDSNEQARANTFKFNHDRHLYVTAHLYVRKILSQYASLSPSSWCFQTNAYGKPFITNHQYTELYFNLSHTQGLIACILAYRQAVGVDVERHRQLHDFNALCQTAFSPLEVADILSLKKRSSQEQRFFTYWTLKESYIKARGMGLSIPLQQFSFIEKKTEKWALHCDSNVMKSGKNWRFSSHKTNEHYLATAVAPSKRIRPLGIYIFDIP
jgi:4'-phosphopantetheinyl transferase